MGEPGEPHPVTIQKALEGSGGLNNSISDPNASVGLTHAAHVVILKVALEIHQRAIRSVILWLPQKPTFCSFRHSLQKSTYCLWPSLHLLKRG